MKQRSTQDSRTTSHLRFLAALLALALLASPALLRAEASLPAAKPLNQPTVAATPAHPIAALLKSDVRDPDAMRQVVEFAYGELRELASSEALPLRFELSGFQTLERSDFDTIDWLSLVDMPGGRMIDMQRTKNFDGRLGITLTRYSPTWTEEDGQWTKTEEGEELMAMTVADVLSELSEADSRYGRVSAITQYSVRVRLGEEERSYAAAVLWSPADKRGGLTFFIIDHITQGVEEALREERPDLTKVRWTRPQAYKASSCEDSVSKKTYYDTKYGFNNHFGTGYHYAYAEVDISCECDSNCGSTCSASFRQQKCEEVGFWNTNSCHKMALAVSTSTDFRGDGVNNPASCAAGLGCVQRACTFCVCGLGISVAILGDNKVNFTPSGDIDWSGNIQFTSTCAPCQTSSSGSGTPPPGGGGGGGVTDVWDYDGGGSGGLWAVDCGDDGSIDDIYYASSYSEAWSIGFLHCDSQQ